ncbi:MAG: acylphosphatase [Candidatus Pacearchaeota archaeon]
MKKAIKLYIFGNVQGIFFRNFIKEKADEVGVKGYVRNKEDGSVECWFEGDIDKVEKLIEICSTQHKDAVIKRIDKIEEKFQNFKEFKIIYF